MLCNNPSGQMNWMVGVFKIFSIFQWLSSHSFTDSSGEIQK